MDTGVEAAWGSEIRERIGKCDAGRTVAVSGQEVFAELDKRLKR